LSPSLSWRQCLPRTLYLKLTEQVKNKGGSGNSLVTAIKNAAGRRQQKIIEEDRDR
jgi:hypothetical protein